VQKGAILFNYSSKNVSFGKDYWKVRNVCRLNGFSFRMNGDGLDGKC